MLMVACKKDNSANLHFQIMSPDLYFYFIFLSGAQLCKHNKYIMVPGKIIEQVSVECLMQE